MEELWLEVTAVQPSMTGGIFVVRFLDGPPEGKYPPFVGVCTVHIALKKARIYGMLGKVSRKHLKHLVKWLLGYEVKEIHTVRDPRHKLPGQDRSESLDNDRVVINLAALRWKLPD